MSPAREGQGADRRVRVRRRLLLAGWVALAAAMVVRAAEVQIVERTAWARDALRQHQTTRAVPAPRGRILDRSGGELAVSHWRATVALAPNEIRDRAEVEAALVAELGVRSQTAGRVSDPTREWSVVPGRYSMGQVAGLRGISGIHIQGELKRLYPRAELARGLLGVVQDGTGAGGIEQAMDTVLAGRPGRDIVARDNRGQEIPGQVVTVEPPVSGPGHRPDHRPGPAGDRGRDAGRGAGQHRVPWWRHRGDRPHDRGDPGAGVDRRRLGRGAVGGQHDLRTRLDHQAVHHRGAAPAWTGGARRLGGHRGRAVGGERSRDHGHLPGADG